MTVIDPEQIFSGVVLVIAPHMDDEVLACGGLLACLPRKTRLHLVYATDGTRSPLEFTARRNGSSPRLEVIRMQEALDANGVLGILEENIQFLGFPDGSLRLKTDKLVHALAQIFRSIRPDQVLAPFRFDRHPDHIALYQAVLRALAQENLSAELYEYFVYSRYRLLPGGDIREYIRPDQRLKVDIQAWSAHKKEALLRYRSQTTLFEDWQNRPVLPPARVEGISTQPEIFLKYHPAYAGAGVLGRGKIWVRLIHLVEPWMKQEKERVLSFLKQGKTPKKLGE